VVQYDVLTAACITITIYKLVLTDFGSYEPVVTVLEGSYAEVVYSDFGSYEQRVLIDKGDL
jgi:hypothetical protein